MSAQFSKRALTAGLGVGALGLLAQTQPTSADTPFTTFPFPATGAPTSRTMPDRLADFVNVKDYGAHGNGSANDTAAIQAALDAAYGPSSSPNGGMGAAKNRAVFFPSGSYIITSPLTLRSAHGAHIFGAGRFTTTITNTTSGGTVFKTNGCEYSRFERMQLIATGAGSICFDLNWDNTGNAALQGNTFADIYFESADYGLRIGGLNNDGYMGSETLILNCHFSNHGQAGLYTGNYNALQQTVIGGNVQNCNYGIYDKYGSVPVISGTGFQLNKHDIFKENSGSPMGDAHVVSGCRSESTGTFLTTAAAFLTVHVEGCTNTGGSGVFLSMQNNRVSLVNCAAYGQTISCSKADGLLEMIGSNFSNPAFLDMFGGVANISSCRVGAIICRNIVRARKTGGSLIRTYDIEANALTDAAVLYAGTGDTVTISNASPAVVIPQSSPNWGHGLPANTPVVFTTTGTLPGGLLTGKTYYVVLPTTTSFNVSATAGGPPINTSSAGSGTHSVYIARLFAVGDQILKANVVPGGSPGWICTGAGSAVDGAVFKALTNVAV